METIESIKNPLAGRLMKVGGKLHKKLIKDGILKGIIEKDENILYEYGEHDDLNFLKEELNKKLTIRQKAVIGRTGSKYGGKIVARSRTPNTKEVVEQTIKTIKTVNDDFDDDMEKYVMGVIMGDNPQLPPKKNKKTKNKTVEFVMEDEEEEDEEELEEYDVGDNDIDEMLNLIDDTESESESE